MSCQLCGALTKEAGRIFLRTASGFAALWDINPATPGHALVLPRRHVQHMRDLTAEEQQSLVPAVVAAKVFIASADLSAVYRGMLDGSLDARSQAYITHALERLEEVGHRPPDAFNDGLNDGPAAGQTVPHLHWHVMPRWSGDTSNPKGGIRHMFAGMGNYHEGLRR